MNRWMRWLDRLFGLGLAAALCMALATAWPGPARAAGGDMATEARSVGNFVAVQTLGPDVRLRSGATTTVTVAAAAQQLPLLETVVEDTRLGRTLVLRWKKGSLGMDSPATWLKRQHAEVTVTVPAGQLSALQVTGAGDMAADGLAPAALSVRIDGSGDVSLTGLRTGALTLAVAGSGDISASGQATRLVVSIAGSGDVKATGLQADAVEVAIAGSGDASVQADKTLVVTIAGSGDVVYSGAAVVRQTIQGTGSVTRR